MTEPPSPDEQPDVVPSDAPPPPIETEPDTTKSLPDGDDDEESWQTLPLT